MQALRWAVLVLAIVATLAFLVLAVVAYHQQFFDLDHAAHDLVRSAPYPALRPLMQALSRIGSGYVLIPLSVAAYVWLVSQALRPQDAPPVLAMDAGESLLAAVFFLPAPFIAVWMAVRLVVAPLGDT